MQRVVYIATAVFTLALVPFVYPDCASPSFNRRHGLGSILDLSGLGIYALYLIGLLGLATHAKGSVLAMIQTRLAFDGIPAALRTQYLATRQRVARTLNMLKVAAAIGLLGMVLIFFMPLNIYWYGRFALVFLGAIYHPLCSSDRPFVA